jgi:hypothetical protein
VIVRGTASDNGEITEVLVNGIAAKSRSANFAEWEAAIFLAGSDGKKVSALRAHAVDAAGNAERLAHVVALE